MSASVSSSARNWRSKSLISMLRIKSGWALKCISPFSGTWPGALPVVISTNLSPIKVSLLICAIESSVMLGSRSRSIVICTRMMRAGSFEPENFTQSTTPMPIPSTRTGDVGAQTRGVVNVEIQMCLGLEQSAACQQVSQNQEDQQRHRRDGGDAKLGPSDLEHGRHCLDCSSGDRRSARWRRNSAKPVTRPQNKPYSNPLNYLRRPASRAGLDFLRSPYKLKSACETAGALGFVHRKKLPGGAGFGSTFSTNSFPQSGLCHKQ